MSKKPAPYSVRITYEIKGHYWQANLEQGDGDKFSLPLGSILHAAVISSVKCRANFKVAMRSVAETFLKEAYGLSCVWSAHDIAIMSPASEAQPMQSSRK